MSLREVGASLGVSKEASSMAEQDGGAGWRSSSEQCSWLRASCFHSVHVQLLPVPVWVFSRCSSSLPRCKNTNIRLMEMVVLASGVKWDDSAQARRGDSPHLAWGAGGGGGGLPSTPQRGLEGPRDGRREQSAPSPVDGSMSGWVDEWRGGWMDPELPSCHLLAGSGKGVILAQKTGFIHEFRASVAKNNTNCQMSTVSSTSSTSCLAGLSQRLSRVP